jgi:hypothetical protein
VTQVTAAAQVCMPLALGHKSSGLQDHETQ